MSEEMPSPVGGPPPSPADSAMRITADVSGARAASSGKQERSILLVEDSRPLRRMLAKIMQTMHFSSAEASEGQEALALLEEKGIDHFALIMVDLMMPGMDGAKFVTEARRTYGPALPPIIICSSRSDREVIQLVAKLGVAGYILKPFKTETVVNKMKEIFPDLESADAS